MGTTNSLGAGGLDAASMASVAGDFYLTFNLDPNANVDVGPVMPLQLNVAVDGRPQGQPEYATPSTPPPPSPTPNGGATSSEVATPSAGPAESPATSPDAVPPAGSGGARPALLMLGVGALFGGAVVAAVWLARRRRASARAT